VIKGFVILKRRSLYVKAKGHKMIDCLFIFMYKNKANKYFLLEN